MRITIVLPYAGMSGGNRVLAIYASRLQRRGHEVSVLSIPQALPSFARKLKSVLRGRGWPSDPAPEHSWFDGLAVPHRVLERVRTVTDADVPDADVVIATFWTTAHAVAALSPRKGAKAIFVQGYETSPGQENPAIDAVWRLPLRKIVISNWLVAYAKERFGDADVHHVPNSVDTEQFHAPPRGRQARPTVGMLYAAGFHAKGTDVALGALQRVRERVPDLKALAFGAEHVAPDLPLPPWSEFHYRPPQDAIRTLYARCDVWLCGSRREGFHLPPLEAMACRCPLVSTRVGGPMDIVEEGVNGFLVDVEDAAGLAERLLRVLAFDEARWKRMSDAALATATGYTWDDATTLLERALTQIAEVKMHR
ncbi:MAG TPA: glycosyltransferase family 4 protein [Burkholderiales bacterium]|nr:glycosyltransferase family 4 protein [Burkholderiales bacterium]